MATRLLARRGSDLTPGEFEQHRRSLYLLNKRTVRLPMMSAFDQPDTMTSCPMRPVSTHALQALSLFNSDFMREESNRLAARLGFPCSSASTRQRLGCTALRHKRAAAC